jgi:GDSL-like Lipase/Acylhydrolase family
MSRDSARWILLIVSLSISSAVAYCVWYAVRSGDAPDTVLIVDNSAAVVAELDRRAEHVEPQPESNTFPPPFVREPLDLKTSKIFFPFVKPENHDPFLHYGHEKNLDVVIPFPEHPRGEYHIQINSEGFRNRREVSATRPDLRILVTGDSHTDGICSNDETFSHRIETLFAARGSVEVLNGACFGYSLYQYLAVIERYASLAPHAFVPVVYGGNDFYSILSLQRYFHRRAAPVISRPTLQEKIEAAGLAERGAVAQELGQVRYFLDNPEDVEVAYATACTLALEIARVCRENRTALLFVYLPPPYRAQPDLNALDLEPYLAAGGFESNDVAVSDRIADRWLEFLADRGIPFVDLRPVTRATTDRLYFRADHHLNVDGHAKVAATLAPRLEALLAPK